MARADLRRQYGDVCWICGRFMRWEPKGDITTDPLGFSRDHVPWKGAPKAVIKPAHRVCNTIRDRKPIDGKIQSICHAVVRGLEKVR